MPTTKITAVLGSSRKNGNTAKVLAAVLGDSGARLFDLYDFSIHHYDYTRPSVEDDFLGIIEQIVESQKIVFATPVYWYSMSGRLKVFFDRFTELVSDRKALGRALAGKDVYLVTSSSEPALPEGFESPFRASCDYMDMNFRDGFHGWCKSTKEPPPEVLREAQAFGLSLRA